MAEAEGTPAPRPIPAGTPLTRSLALCLDTLGQNRDFTPDQLAVVKRVASTLQTAYTRTEQHAYEQEYAAAREAVSLANADHKNAMEGLVKVLADAAAKGEAATSALPEDAQEDVRALAKARPVWEGVSALLGGVMEDVTLEAPSTAGAAGAAEGAPATEGGEPAADAAPAEGETAPAPAALPSVVIPPTVKARVGGSLHLVKEVLSRRISPKPEVLRILQAAWFLCGGRPTTLGDPKAGDALAPTWSGITAVMHKDDWLEKLATYNPEAEENVAGAGRARVHMTAESIKGLLGVEGGATPEEVGKTSVPAALLLAYVSAAVDVRDAADAQRKREAAEEEERKRVEAEAKAAEEEAARLAAEEAAAAAAEAAAAAAEGGEGAAEEGSEE